MMRLTVCLPFLAVLVLPGCAAVALVGTVAAGYAAHVAAPTIEERAIEQPAPEEEAQEMAAANKAEAERQIERFHREACARLEAQNEPAPNEALEQKCPGWGYELAQGK